MARDPISAFMKKRLDEYPDEFRPCRESRHWWDEKGLFRFADEGERFIVIRYRCERCLADKRLYYNRDGTFQFSRITYPKGYLFKLTDKEREEGFRFTSRTMLAWKVRRARGLDNLE